MIVVTWRSQQLNAVSSLLLVLSLFPSQHGERAHPDLNQGPADLQSAALATELCTHVDAARCNDTSAQSNERPRHGAGAMTSAPRARLAPRAPKQGPRPRQEFAMALERSFARSSGRSVLEKGFARLVWGKAVAKARVSGRHHARESIRGPAAQTGKGTPGFEPGTC